MSKNYNKELSFRSSSGSQRSAGQYRIGMTDSTLDLLWNPETEKYKVLCRMVHVTKATLHISYIQMIINFMLLMFFTYYYMMAITGNLTPENFATHYYSLYISVSQLIFALSLQLILVVAVIHGVRTERRSLLLPYIIYTAVAILAGCAQLINDFVNLDHANNSKASTLISDSSRVYENGLFLRQFFGTMIYAWCLSVVWRCYTYLGDKKVAIRIAEQLNVTQAAFQYPEDSQLIGYWPLHNQMPPPYADTVLSPTPSQKPVVFVNVAPERQEVPENDSETINSNIV